VIRSRSLRGMKRNVRRTDESDAIRGRRVQSVRIVRRRARVSVQVVERGRTSSAVNYQRVRHGGRSTGSGSLDSARTY
jgi:hypothetical protein